MRVRRRFDFEAAHVLPRHPGKCRALHGHSYRLIVTVERPVDPESGMAMDFGSLKQVVRSEVVDRLDHTHLNDLLENPTAEVVARWIWERLAARLPGLEEVELFETRECSVVHRGGRE
jgi:6-pyruvoyltetrahydropterin/6-carboxytetrahydropterin synthase